jgi:DNA polymerase bacteriophage-type
MELLVLDFETFYSKEYTLTNMTTEEYVRDARFEALMLGVYKPSTNEQGWIPREDIQAWLDTIDWSETAILAHHAHFDGSIFNWIYNVRPAFWFCSLSMANLVHGASQRVSLAALAEKYGLEAKKVPYDLFYGKHWHQLDDRTRDMMGDGAIHDCKLAYQIFQLMLPDVPECELELIDTTIRMFTEPVLEGDLSMLREICRHEINAKAEAIHKLGVTTKELQSTPLFRSLLEQEGIEIEYKKGKETKKNPSGLIPAFAKTDEFMKELLEHDNMRVVSLCEARLGVKSTLNETRSGRLLRMTERGPLPVYLRYYGTHTGRSSGGDKMNWQNFPRKDIEAKDAQGDIINVSLRKSICAPPGHKLVIVDLSQIECRVLMWLAGEEKHLEAFREGRDVYCELASTIYGRPINKAEHPDERQLGKMTKLSCGYGTAHKKLQNSARIGASGGKPIILSDEEAKACVNAYRHDHPGVADKQNGYWTQCRNLISFIAAGGEGDFGPFTIRDKKVISPTGSFINYQSLVSEFDEETGKMGWFFYKKGKSRVRIYGGLMTENFTSHLATHCVKGDVIIELKRHGQRVLWETHDDLVQCVPEDEAEDVLKLTLELCKQTPTYMPGLPLDAEGGIYDRYEK